MVQQQPMVNQFQPQLQQMQLQPMKPFVAPNQPSTGYRAESNLMQLGQGILGPAPWDMMPVSTYQPSVNTVTNQQPQTQCFNPQV
ncbi:hypothetical protein RIF29_29020 [Crotalaria pallida]|uniref:Uncharacterized protein n=1 Tax=Crotalaria pallida TaxID=3830 RepID=A0AAN9HVJ3_CROPI